MEWKRVALGGFLFGWAYHLVYLAWLPALHPLTWIGFTAWQSVIIVGALYLSVTALGGLLIGSLLTLYNVLFDYCRKKYWIAMVLIFGFPVFWTLMFSVFDIAQLWIPWPLLSYTQTHPSSFFHAFYAGGEIEIVFFNMLLAWSLFMAPGERRAVVAIAFFFLMSILALNERQEKILAGQKKLALPVAILQGNLPIDVVRSERASWDAAKSVYLDNIKSLTLKPDTLLVLPEEGPVSGWVNIEAPAENTHFRELMQSAREKKIHIITGTSAYRVLPTDAREYFNAMALIAPDGRTQFYFKRDLVPFGERIPFVDKNWLAEQLRAFSVNFNPPYIPGERNAKALMLTTAGKQIPVGGLICFELIKPELARIYGNPGILVNTSNLGWFHGNRFGERLMQQQFLAIGQMRAAENRAYVVISANTGISAVIDPLGNVVASSDRDGKPLPGGATLVVVDKN